MDPRRAHHPSAEPPAPADPPPGSRATAELHVGDQDLATVLNQRPGDAFPPVFATARMVGLMELAAARLLQPRLAAGELSVGVGVDVQHTAATPAGVRVEAEARYLGREGRLHLFEVVARDPGGEIGRCLHRRAVVDAARLVAGTLRRCAPAEG